MCYQLDNLGELAIAQQNYAATEHFCLECLDVARELNIPNIAANALCHLGRAACGLENYTTARNYLKEGLSLAVEIQAIPHILEALTYFSILFMAEGSKEFKPERTTEILAFVLKHPATFPYVQAMTRRQLTKLEAQLPADVFERTQARGKAKALDVVVAEILADT